MKNLSLLLLTLTALPLEAAPKKDKSTPTTAAANSLTYEQFPSIASQKLHSTPTIIAVQPKASTAPISQQLKSGSFASLTHSSIDQATTDDDERSNQVDMLPFQRPFFKTPDSYKDRFVEESYVKENLNQARTTFVKNLEAHKALLPVKDIAQRLNEIPYIRPIDETNELKTNFNPTFDALKIGETTLSRLSQTPTKELRSEIYKTIPEPEATKNPKLAIKIRTRPLSEIVAFITKKQIDPYAIFTESSRTISNCGQSIIEGSRVSDIENTATNFAQSPERKTAILQAKRIAEFTVLLEQLESYTKARDLETSSQARLSELETKASQLETKLLNPISEKERIATERTLLSITREKAGIIGQLEGAKKDRIRKNNAICVARTEIGSLKATAIAGLFGAKTASYTSDVFETPLMIDELYSKVLPHLSKEEKKAQASAFLDALLLKKRPSSPTRLTWTGQQSVKMTSYPEFSCIKDGKDLSGKQGTEREMLSFTTEEVRPLQLSSAIPLLEIYKHRAGLTPDETTTDLTTPTLEQLRAQPKKWHFNQKTKTWSALATPLEEPYNAIPATVALAVLGGAASEHPADSATAQ